VAQIRPQTAADLPFVCSLLQRAFESPAEADLVVQLFAGDFVRLALVAERDGQLVGQVLFSEVVVNDGPKRHTALALAPVAVLPEFQRQGIGTALIRSGLEQCTAADHALVFVLGEPEFYARFGFGRERGAAFVSPYAGDYFLAIDLPGTAPELASGTLRYPPPFDALSAAGEPA
jgi:putative acetyltransferase